MAGFIRRYGFFPPVELITQIEGVVIADLPPPGAVNGVGTGVACLVGEFADHAYAVAVNPTTGVVTTSPRPVEIFSAQDLIDKVGGLDGSLGNFGGDMGNGFVELRSKKFSRLIVVPVNLASSQAVRVTRKLPTNTSLTDATPVVPLSIGELEPGQPFGLGVQSVRLSTRWIFTAFDPKDSGIDGSVTAVGAAVTQIFSAPGATFQTDGIAEGDALVLGLAGGVGAAGANADTYRVVSVSSQTAIVVEKQDGTSFNWTTGAALPWRVHTSGDADSGGDHQLSEAPGYQLPARPTAATIGPDIAIALTTPAPPIDATSADPLSGALLITDPSVGLTHTAAVQALNAANSAGLEALYSAAIDATLEDIAPVRDINLIWAARKSAVIRSLLASNVLQASEALAGRTTQFSPSLDVVLTPSAAITDVAVKRNERNDYVWPGVRVFIPEMVGLIIPTATGGTTTDGIIDVTSDGWLTAVLSNLPPEKNPGQAGPPVPTVLAPILDLQRGVTGLTVQAYTQFRAQGIVAPRLDQVVGPIFQSGITTSATSGQTNINRRRMADFIEDSLARTFLPFAKLLLTLSLKDSVQAQAVAFMEELLSPDNPPAQRVSAYEVDSVSGNTPSLEAKGIFVLVIRVRTLATADFIVLQAEIGEGVVITQV